MTLPRHEDTDTDDETPDVGAAFVFARCDSVGFGAVVVGAAFLRSCGFFSSCSFFFSSLGGVFSTYSFSGSGGVSGAFSGSGFFSGSVSGVFGSSTASALLICGSFGTSASDFTSCSTGGSGG
jgi:hypothetical protein